MNQNILIRQVAVIFLLIGIVSCTPQTTVDSSPKFDSSPSATITPVVATQFAFTETLPAATLVVSTPTPSPSISASYASLPVGQYIISAEVSNKCEEKNIYIVCNDLRVTSMDGSINELLVEGLPGEGFRYKNGQIASTKTFWDPNQQHHQIQVFSLIDDINSEIQNPFNKECMAGDWPLDGDQLIALCRSRDEYRFFEIALLSIKDEEFATLLQDPNDNDASGGYEQPRLSRDGKWLAFYRLFGKGPELVEGLYIMDMSCLPLPESCKDKTYRLPIANLTGDYGNRIIDWTSEGYLSRVFDNLIEVYDVVSQRVIRTLTADAKRGQILEMSWSPDGEWALIRQSDAPGVFLISTIDGQETHLDIGGEDPFWLTIP